MQHTAAKSIVKGFSLVPFLTTLLVGIALLAACAVHAQTTIFNNTNATNELPYNQNGTGEDYNALYAFTTIGTGSVKNTAWKVSSFQVALYNEGSRVTDQVLFTFYQTMNVAATGSTTVNSNPIAIYDLVTPITMAANSINTLTITTPASGFYLANATNAATYGLELSITNSGLTTFDPNVHPLLTYTPTVGSDPGSSIWENTNTGVPDAYTGSNALSTSSSGHNYNVFLMMNATAVPGPSAWAVLLTGAAPLAGLLRRRKK